MNQTKGEFSKVLFALAMATAVSAVAAAGEGEPRPIECVAHRGYWNAEIPENTVEAIRRAYAVGANWVETDFNLESDGRMLCYHDAKRRDAVIKPPFRVPTLEEVLAVVPKDRGLQCEIKTYGPGYAEKFDRAVRAAGLSETNIIVSSFKADALKDFKRLKPSYRTLLLAGVGEKTTPEALIAKGRDLGVFAICPGATQAKQRGWSAAEADKIRAAGFSFRLFGVNTPEMLKFAAETRAEAFTCNFFEAAFTWAKSAGIKLVPPSYTLLETQAADRIALEGEYAGHLQDVWMTSNAIWWAHTESLVRTDRAGRIVRRVEVGGHHAGLEVKDGRLYTAVCAFNGEPRRPTTPACHVMIGEYDAETLARIEMHVLDVNDRAGSLCLLEDGSFLVGCLRHPSLKPSEVKFHHIGRDYKLVKTHVVDVGRPVEMGIEVIRRYGNDLYLFIYGCPTVRLDARTFEKTGRLEISGGQTGFAKDGDSVWVGTTARQKDSKAYRSGLIRVR